ILALRRVRQPELRARVSDVAALPEYRRTAGASPEPAVGREHALGHPPCELSVLRNRSEIHVAADAAREEASLRVDPERGDDLAELLDRILGSHMVDPLRLALLVADPAIARQEHAALGVGAVDARRERRVEIVGGVDPENAQV